MNTHAYGTGPDGKQQTAFLRDLVSAHFHSVKPLPLNNSMDFSTAELAIKALIHNP
jgi:hypothetical protein